MPNIEKECFKTNCFLHLTGPAPLFYSSGCFPQGIQFIFGKGSFAVHARIEQPQGIEQLAEKEGKPSPFVEVTGEGEDASGFGSGWLQAPLHPPVGGIFYPRSLLCTAKVL